jgi:hypothetical protein
MIEVVGDSARGEELAFVRLTVDGDRIVDAGRARARAAARGLTLLEAAAVPARRSRPTRSRTRSRRSSARPDPGGSQSR